MRDDQKHLAWGAMKLGPRPSTMLIAGAMLGALGPLLNHLGQAHVAWPAWALSLLLVGLGLLLSGLRPWLTWIALVPAGFYLLQGASLGLAASGYAPAARAYELLALPKLLTLALLALAAVRQLETWRRRWLLAGALLAAVKPLLRLFAIAPAPLFTVLDPLLAMVLAWSLITAARGLRRLETAWAVRRFDETHASLEDFNPPPLPPVRGSGSLG